MNVRSLNRLFALTLGFLVLSAAAIRAQVLSYSAYVVDTGGFFEGPGNLIAINASGEECLQILSATQLTLTELRADGSLIYSIPGNKYQAIAIDPEGNCYVAGNGKITPTAGAFQTVPRSATNAQFVEKFGTSGNVVYATYLNGSASDVPGGIAVDSYGNAYLTGSTTSNDFPTLNAYQPELNVGPDAFISVLNATGSGLVYSTYWGGGNQNAGTAIAVDSSGYAYITGWTDAYGFPLVAPFQDTYTGSAEYPNMAFVIKLDSAGQPVYSTYFGCVSSSNCNYNVTGLAIATDNSGSAYVTGVAGAGMPLVNPFQSTNDGFTAFVSKFNPNGSALVYSTYLGEGTNPVGIGVDSAGQAYIGGWLYTSEVNFPTSAPVFLPIQSSFGTGVIGATTDGFVGILNAQGSALVFSTYLGGEDDSVSGFGIDGAATSNIYLSGSTGGAFPITNAPVTSFSNGTYVPVIAGNCPFIVSPCLTGQGFLAKISLSSGTSFSYPNTVDLTKDPQPVGSSTEAVPVMIANSSASGDIAISNIALQGDFSQTNNCPGTLLAATNCELQLIFTPTAGGQRTGTITITDSAPGSPHIIDLLGTGEVPVLQIAPTSLTFGAQAVGTTSGQQIITLTNTGTANLTVTLINTTGDFTESNTCPGLSPGAECTITVTFTPSATGTRTGTLTIVDNAAGSPETVMLSGTGASPEIGFTIAPGGSSTATVQAGAEANYSLAVGAAGMSGSASLTCIGVPPEATCSVPPTVNFTAQTQTVFSASVNTTAHTVSALHSPRVGGLAWLWSTVIAGLVLAPMRLRKRHPPRPRFLSSIALMLLLLLLACSGGGSSNTSQKANGTPAGTYNLTVTATLGSATQSTTLTLIVQ
jgi:hypothetical protein